MERKHSLFVCSAFPMFTILTCEKSSGFHISRMCHCKNKSGSRLCVVDFSYCRCDIRRDISTLLVN